MMMFLLGLLTMSLIVTAVVTLQDFDILPDNENITQISYGPVNWVVWFVCWVIGQTRRNITRLKYKAMVVVDGQVYWCDCETVDDYDLTFTKFDEYAKKEGWDADDWNPKYRSDSWARHPCGNVRYAPRKVWKRYPKLPKELQMQFKLD